ncbi:MAG: hypothetical protein Q8L16_13075, partial [Hydrogenophaga sp.]|nr:hypothetical protein [Hydrogenophaga sp.]
MPRRWLAVRIAALACWAVLSAGPVWAQARGQDRILILDVTVNGQRLNGAQEVGQSADGRWSLPSALWTELRWLAPQALVSEGPLAGHAWLDQMPGVQLAFDAE